MSSLFKKFCFCSSQLIDDLSFEGLCEHWKTKGFKNIITMVGAGISTCKLISILMRLFNIEHSFIQ